MTPNLLRINHATESEAFKTQLVRKENVSQLELCNSFIPNEIRT